MDSLLPATIVEMLFSTTDIICASEILTLLGPPSVHSILSHCLHFGIAYSWVCLHCHISLLLHVLAHIWIQPEFLAICLFDLRVLLSYRAIWEMHGQSSVWIFFLTDIAWSASSIWLPPTALVESHSSFFWVGPVFHCDMQSLSLILFVPGTIQRPLHRHWHLCLICTELWG